MHEFKKKNVQTKIKLAQLQEKIHNSTIHDEPYSFLVIDTNLPSGNALGFARIYWKKYRQQS